MRKTLQDSDIYTIMDNSPHPYPSPVKINNISSKKHTIRGCRFEISILMHAVELHIFCGLVHPSQINPKLPNNPPLERNHIMNHYAPAWECNNQSVCRGSYFFLPVEQLIYHSSNNTMIINHHGIF